MVAEWIENSSRYRLRQTMEMINGLSPEQATTIRKLDSRWVLAGLGLRTREWKIRYMIHLGRYLKRPFEKATKEDIEGYLIERSNVFSKSTMILLKAFVKACYKQLLAPDSPGYPTVVAWIYPGNPLKCRKLPEDMVTPEEVKRIAQSTWHPRDRAVVTMLYESAARVSELAGLRVKDAQFDQYGARIMVNGKTGQRIVRLINSVPDLRDWLNNHPRRDDPEAPLFLSMDRSRRYQGLLGHGIAEVLRYAARAAGVRKRVHPHLFRHSRLTELARHLSESELKVFAGWTADSQMARVYIHLSGDDVERKLLARAGILPVEETKKEEVLASRKCPRCETANSAATSYCAKCSLPLDENRLMQLAKEYEAFSERLPALMELLEDPDVKKLLFRKAQEANIKGPAQFDSAEIPNGKQNSPPLPRMRRRNEPGISETSSRSIVRPRRGGILVPG